MNTPAQNNFDRFPAELKAKSLWCVWRLEDRGDGKKPTKVPYQVSGRRASSTDAATWATFDEVCAAAPAFSGIGIFADGSHTFIDLDGCIADGVIQPWARAVLLRCGSYAELSPSGTGLHIFVAGAVEKPSKINGCEIYSTARYFTVTGQHVADSPLTIREMPAAELEELRQDIADGALRPKQEEKPTERRRPIALDRFMTHSEREEKLNRALSGDYSDYSSRSEAVHGALQILARKHQGDAEKMAEEFEASELCGMWGEKWDRLADSEIAKAVERWQENDSPKWGDGEARSPWSLVRYSTIQAKPVDWFWKGYLAAGKLTMVNGEPGHGKSLVSIDAAARITMGKHWPDGTPNTLPPSSVILLTEEEDAGDTIKPRLLAAGGDPDKLYALNIGVDAFRIESHTERLRKLIQEQAPDTKLIILDPVSDYTGVDTHRDNEVRPMLNKLRELAASLGAAALGINHLNKKTDLGAIHRVSGARAWVSFARLNFLVGRTDDGRRHLASLKTNIAKDGLSLSYEIVDRALTFGTLIIPDVPYVCWTGAGAITAEDLAAPPHPQQKDEVEVWLREKLADGGWHDATELFTAADEAGFHKKKVQRVADKKLRVNKEQQGMPARWFWRSGVRVEDSGVAF